MGCGIFRMFNLTIVKVMPTPISHIVLTEKLYEKYFFEKDRKNFYIGTCFPDIRRNAGLKREKLHTQGVEIEDVLNEKNSFIAGLKMHSLVDEVSKKYFKKTKIYKLCPEGKYKIHSLKVLEDKLCYSEIQNWKEFSDYLDTVLPEELEFGVDQRIIQNWHTTLQKYFSQKPDRNSIHELFRRVSYSEDDCNEINRLVDLLEEDENIIYKINDFHKGFLDKIT